MTVAVTSLPAFGAGTCPKCDMLSTRVVYVRPANSGRGLWDCRPASCPDEEHMHRICVCGFVWAERTKDAAATPA